MGRLALAAALLLAAACAREARDGDDAAAIPAPVPGAPVVLITIDTLRADRLPLHGYTGIDTPHVDELAAGSVVFRNAASTVPFTLPAHSSIMTGTYPPRHGVRENVGYVLGDELPTLAELLAAAGYATAGFVSAFVLDGRWGIGRGFDEYHDEFRLEELASANMASVQRDGAETVAAAAAWLGRLPAERPFFLWVHLFEPHDPYEPPEPHRSRYPGRSYDGEIAYADELVGRLLAALDERGLGDGALVVLTGDHGEGLGEHGEAYHGYFVYDSTTHVPLILRLPHGAAGGRTVSSPVSHVDLMPTILAAIGQPVPAAIDGASLLPLVAREDTERIVYSESLYPLLHYGWAPLRAVRAGALKLIDAPRPELFDLAADPSESRDLLSEPAGSGEDPRVSATAARDLERRLAGLRRSIESGAPALAPVADLAAEDLAQLRALGYLAGQGAIDPAEEEAVERADPKDKIALHRLIMAAQSALGSGETAVAQLRLREALEQDPDLLDAHQMLGNLAGGAGRHEEAAEHFRRALALGPEHRASLFGLAVAYRELGRAEDAVLGFRHLLALEPHDSKAALALGDLLSGRGQAEAALAALEGAAAGREAPAVLHNQIGELLALLGRRDEARSQLEAAVAGNPDLAQPWFNLGVLDEDSGDLAAAQASYEKAIALAPRHFQAQFNLGRLNGRLGRPERQQELWEDAIASNPAFARGYFLLAKLIMDRGGDLTRAEELAREGIERDAGGQAGPLGWYVLADVLGRQGRRAEAAEAARRGREIEAGSATSSARRTPGHPPGRSAPERPLAGTPAPPIR